MNKTFVLMGLLMMVASFVSCASTQPPSDSPQLGGGLPSINGEWQMVEVEGVSVSEYGGESVPYVGFDVQSGRVWGSSGCNRLLGSFTYDASTGAIDLSAMGSTKMLCASMKLEDAVLRALGKTVRYGSTKEGGLVLYDSENVVLIKASPIKEKAK